MIRLTQNVKIIALAAAILFGLAVEHNHAHAAGLETATVAGGCFWCVEHDFEKLPGVTNAVSGFTGGKTANPTYKQVTKGKTGHIEAVQITYDPAKLSYADLLNKFFRSVDPTDRGGQFCDRGPTYTTAIFVNSPAERKIAEAEKAKAEAALNHKIVTPILDAGTFYAADDYHQDYAKSTSIVLTRFGPLSKAKAYKRYRTSCGRDAAIKKLWGNEAAFIN
jgi:peptide-methionine (S)-S-oxide reductase